MRKLLYPIAVVLIALSCTPDKQYEEINRDPNRPKQATPAPLFTGAIVSLVNQMESTNQSRNIFRLVAQYWTQTTYTSESNFNLVNRSLPKKIWNELYTNVLYDLKIAKESASNAAQKAQIEVL